LSQGSGCDDSTLCNGHETCNDQGNCVPGAPAPVDDGQPCTVDSCDPVAGVRHVPASAGVSCDDQTVCNGRELCNGSGSCLPGAPLSLDDHDPCTNDVCDAALGVSHPAAASGTSCSDGNACNGDERCNGGGQCAAGAAPVLDDGNRCTTDSCDSATGAVRHDPLPGGSSCANASLCDGAETCNGSGVCQPGVALIVDDGNACTADSCDPSIGVKHVLNPSGSCVAPGRWDTLIASQPSPRDGAAGTFTSAGELFLFGGENAGTSLADTWLWSAAQNGWRRGTNGPSARVGAGVAFDSQRQRIIVVGGVGGADAGASYFGDTWEYSAATDSWLARPATTLPPSRAMAAFAYDSSKQRGLLFGGVGATHLADTWEWDASSGVWTQVSGQGPSARFGAAFAFDPAHGVFVLFGGSPQGVTGGALNDTWTFNSTTGLWSQRSPATKPPARAGASMTFDASASRLVMIGGTSVDALNLADAWDFDASANTWVQLSAPSTPAQTGAVAGFDPVTGQVLAATGLDYSDSGRFTGDAVAIWAYSRTTQGWLARSATTAPARLDLGAAFNSNTGRVVMRSTVNVSDASTRPMMWDYDGASRKWQATDASATETDFGSGAFKEDPFVTNFLVYDSDRKLTLRLAADATTSAGFGWIRVAEWNGEQWRAGCNVSATDATDVGASKGTANYDPPRKRVLVFGSGRIMALNPATCAVSLITVPGPAAKDFVSIGWDADRDVFVMFGGAQLLEPQSDTWEFNPLSNTWSAVPALGPSGRSGGSMAYDSVRKKLVLYGGGVYNSAAKRDTWEYSVGTHAWSLLSTGGGPANGRAWIVFDSLRKQSLLMGTDGSVWSWDGAIWNQEVNSAAPSARSGMSGGWVPSLGAGLFFGGTSGDGRRAFLNDLWLWNGGWRQVSPPGGNASPSLWGATWQPRFGVNSVAAVGPTARTGHVLATGSSAGSVLFGGESDNGLLSDTWLLDDTSLEWSLQRSSPSPSPRTGHSMAVSTNGYVLFGGLAHPNGGTDTLVNDTWFWSPGVWSQMNLSGSPPSARYGQAMATDDASKIVILFGGRDASGVLADTWMLNLNTLQSTGWQKLTPANSPLPRFGHAMSFDSARGRIVLTGGAGALPSQSFGDTWEWDAPNTTWVKRNVTLFDARAGHTEFFDQNLQQTLQFGGFAYDATGQSARTHGDTLAFSGAAQIDPPFTHPNGDKCSAGSTCTSGVCVDGVCCNTACNSQCAACDVAGFQGTCIATSGAPHGARPSCGGSGGPCDSACNGTDMTACHSAPTGTSCGPAPGCNGGYLVQAPGACNGTGTCTQTMTSCLPYACNPTNPGFECLRNCSMDSQCFSSDYRCSASDSYGTCFERDKILSLNVSPAAPKVGVPLTITVQGSRAGSKYFFRFLNAAQISFQYPCTDSYVASSTNTMTCSFTPAAADVGTGRVDVYSMAPGSFLGQDDIKSVQFSIGAAQ
jgi:N-acetylneuraminic acid mutarotase